MNLWYNRAKVKYLKATISEMEEITASKKSSNFYKIFLFLKTIGIAKILVKFALKLSLYPSVLYTVKK